jgi:hypothetical protein
LKRETRITSALDEIERDKSTLNVWLGQNSVIQLDGLRSTLQDSRDRLEKVDRHIVNAEQSFREELFNLSTSIHNSSDAVASGFESLRILGAESVASIGQYMQQYHGETQLESSAMQLQLHALVSVLKLSRFVRIDLLTS